MAGTITNTIKITAILAPREEMKAIMSALKLWPLVKSRAAIHCVIHNKWGASPCGERLNNEISGH